MSGKDNKPSKKAVREKEKKTIEDSTFGLKNKNKSKKVQQFINRVEKCVKHSTGTLEKEKAKEQRKESKLLKKLQEEEMRQLFNEAIGNQYGVKKSKAQNNAALLGLTTASKEVTAFLETLSSDSSDDSDSDSDVDEGLQIEDEDDVPSSGVEIFREKTIEDIIEEQRSKLAAEGKKGTPVTAETFAKWKSEKAVRRLAQIEAKVKAEQTKKKGGKGLSVLSGKELFIHNSSLFIDDESAFDTTDDKTLNAEIKAMEELEEMRIKEESAKAQAEQMRLFELQRVEMEARRIAFEERMKAAQAANHKSFVFNGLAINEIVFDEDEEEDLELFIDEPFLPANRKKIQDEIRLLIAGLTTLSIKKNKKKIVEEEEDDDDDQAENDDEGDDGEWDQEEGEDDEDDNEEQTNSSSNQPTKPAPVIQQKKELDGDAWD